MKKNIITKKDIQKLQVQIKKLEKRIDKVERMFEVDDRILKSLKDRIVKIK